MSEDHDRVIFCGCIMKTSPDCVHKDEKLGTAIKKMIDGHIRFIPVLDGDGVLLGEVNAENLVHNLLPKSMRLLNPSNRSNFLRETIQDFKERLDAMLEDKVKQHLQTMPMVVETAPAAQALAMICNTHRLIAVVDNEKDKKLKGIIDFTSILSAIEKCKKVES
ncbi:MAG: HPP family protein [Alphaproteobacteria bacterium]